MVYCVTSCFIWTVVGLCFWLSEQSQLSQQVVFHIGFLIPECTSVYSKYIKHGVGLSQFHLLPLTSFPQLERNTFEFFTNYTKMSIWAFSSVLHKNTMKYVTSSGNRTQASHNLWFQVQQATFSATEACASEELLKFLFIQYLIFGLWWFSYNQ